MTDIDALSARLREAEATGRPTGPLTEISAGDVDTAYAVQQASVAAWTAAGRRLVGRKIGLTNTKVQAQLGVDQPDFGALFEDMAYADGSTVPYGAVLQPRIEAEVALAIDRGLNDPELSMDDLVAAVALARPALEIVGSRVADWKITIVDTVADNASSGAFVLGADSSPLADVDVAAVSMELTRTRGGIDEVVSTGSGADCLGSPLIAAHWLARELAQRGTPLAAGDILLTGALGPMTPVEPGDRFRAEIASLGSVTASFSP